MGSDEYAALTAAARRKAFTVSGVAQLDVVNDVWKALDRAIEKGTSFEDFKKAVREKLTAAWGTEDAHRLSVIFRDNTQLAYSAGRVKQLRSGPVAKARPFWKLSAILDGRTSNVCLSLNGTIRPADDPWWNSRQPPLHHLCRTHIIGLTEAQAQRMGITEKPPDVAPAPGFGNVEDDEDWQADLSKYPEPLADAYRAKAETKP